MLSVAAPFNPALKTALSGCAPKQVAAAKGLFQRELPDLRAHPNSILTGDGFPLVCTFTTADCALRWTADLSPEGDNRRRADLTVQAFGRLTGTAFDLPHPGTASFGAWLGGRVGCDGELSFKLYKEPGDSDGCGPLNMPSLAGFQPKLRMIGYGAEQDVREYYYRFEDSTPYLLKCLMAIAEQSHRFRDVMELIERNARRPTDSALPGRAIGASFAFVNGGSLPLLTIYFFARALWGSDAAIRRRFIPILQAAGQRTKPYAQASAPIGARRKLHTLHDMAALTIAPDGHAWSIGLRPMPGDICQIN